MRSAPQLVEYYKSDIANNPKVEMVLMAGENDGALEAWAKKVKMPWPMVSKTDHQSMPVVKKLMPRGWPTYYLVDAEGAVLAKGVGSSAAVKAKIKEVAGT